MTLNLDLFHLVIFLMSGVDLLFIYLPKCVALSGILRYRVDFQGLDYQAEDDELFDLDDY